MSVENKQTIGLSPEQVAAVEAHTAESGRNPKAVVDAFTGSSRTSGRWQIERMTLGHFFLFERLDHPFAVGSDGSISNRDLITAIFLLTRPPKEARAILADGEESWEDAIDAFADGIEIGELQELATAVNASVNAAFATIIPSEKKTETESLPDSAGD